MPGVCSCRRVPRPPHRMTTRWVSCGTRAVCPRRRALTCGVRRFARGSRPPPCRWSRRRRARCAACGSTSASRPAGSASSRRSSSASGRPRASTCGTAQYESVDAEVLWAMAAELKPRRVMVGRGRGSMTRKRACRRPPEADAAGRRPGHAGRRATSSSPAARTPSWSSACCPSWRRACVVHLHPLRLPWPAGPRAGPPPRVPQRQPALRGPPRALRPLTREHPEVVRQAVPSWRGASEPARLWLRRT